MDNSQLTRRELLQAGVAAAAGTAAVDLVAETLPGQRDRRGPRWIDAHSHIWTRDVKAYPLAKGRTVADLSPRSFTTGELNNVSRPEGVGRVVLIQHHTYYGWDNSYMVDAAKRSPARFRVVGMVDDTRPHPDVAMRKLLKQKVTGFRITPRIRGRDKWLGGKGMAAMWKCAAETGQAMCCLIDPADLPAVDGMCLKYPATRVVIDHFARIGTDGRIRDKHVKQLCRLARHKQAYLKISAYYALGNKKPPYLDLLPMIRSVYDAFGPQRLMWASDSPYQVVGVHTYRASIDLVKHRLDFASAADKDWLLRKTAENVYFFDA